MTSGEPRMLTEARAFAERRAQQLGRRFIVYYDRGPDRWGRTEVWYVRESTEEHPTDSNGRPAEIVYRTEKS